MARRPSLEPVVVKKRVDRPTVRLPRLPDRAGLAEPELEAVAGLPSRGRLRVFVLVVSVGAVLVLLALYQAVTPSASEATEAIESPAALARGALPPREITTTVTSSAPSLAPPPPPVEIESPSASAAPSASASGGSPDRVSIAPAPVSRPTPPGAPHRDYAIEY